MAPYQYLRSTGYEEGHVSKTVCLDPALFYQLPLYFGRWYQYTDMLKHLYELRDYARHNIDTVVSVGIEAAPLFGVKVIFDVQ